MTRLLLSIVLVLPILASTPAAGDIYIQSAPDRAFTLVMSGTTFNGMHATNTPLLEAYLGETTMFTILVPVAAEAHTFHLHGHPWFVPDDSISTPLAPAKTGTIVDTFLMLPGDSHTFTVTAGGIDKQPGDWMYHCHFDEHIAAGMWGIFRVYPNAMHVSGAGPVLGVKVDHLGVPVEGATFTATFDGQPLGVHVVEAGGGEYALHTALTATTRGVLVLTSHAANGDSIARVGLGGALVPPPTLRSENPDLPAVAHAHGG